MRRRIITALGLSLALGILLAPATWAAPSAKPAAPPGEVLNVCVAGWNSVATPEDQLTVGTGKQVAKVVFGVDRLDAKKAAAYVLAEAREAHPDLAVLDAVFLTCAEAYPIG